MRIGELRVESFKLPRDSRASSNKYYSTLEAKKGTLVWGITDGRGHWFRHCWLDIERARECLGASEWTPAQIACNVCTDTTYAILTA